MNHQARGGNEPPEMAGCKEPSPNMVAMSQHMYLCGGSTPPKSVAYLGQGKSTNIDGTFQPPVLQCVD